MTLCSRNCVWNEFNHVMKVLVSSIHMITCLWFTGIVWEKEKILQGHSVRTFSVNTLKTMFKLINLYSFLHFPAEDCRRKQVLMESLSLIISYMPYPGSLNKDELLKMRCSGASMTILRMSQPVLTRFGGSLSSSMACRRNPGFPPSLDIG